jgi:hypothetical protein
MLVSLAVLALGFLLLASFVIALGASSTERFEFERNRVQPQRQRQRSTVASSGGLAGWAADATRPVAVHDAENRAEVRAEHGMAVGVATHPAGRRLGQPESEPAWWLIDEAGADPVDAVIAGPFTDRIDADWAALSSALAPSVRAVHGVQRSDGSVARRQLPREKAWLEELGAELDRLPPDWDELLTDDDALTTLVVEVAAALVEAGLHVHDCNGEEPAGGVCLTPGPFYGGVVVSWHQHDRMSEQRVRGEAMESVVQRTMNAAVTDLLDRMGFEVEPFGDGGSCLVLDIRGEC